jgi:hypothetical protein
VHRAALQCRKQIQHTEDNKEKVVLVERQGLRQTERQTERQRGQKEQGALALLPREEEEDEQGQ